MKLTRLVGLLAAVLTVSSGAAFAGGYFQNWPVVGATSCALFAGDGVTCVETVPAGPAMTGKELFPADTQAPNGNQPQTVRVPATVIGAGLSVYAAPLTGTTIAVNAQTSNLVLNPAGTIAALTVALPAASALVEGQTLKIGSSQIITAITVTGGTGTTVVGVQAAAIGAAGSGFEIIYHATSPTAGTWFRLN